jgi:hypothetical protein
MFESNKGRFLAETPFVEIAGHALIVPHFVESLA